jgi:hypothetical protein
MAVNWKHVADTLKLRDIDLNTSYDALNLDQVKLLVEQLKLSGYRPPKNASAAPADMFYAAIQRKMKVRPNASIIRRRIAAE